MMSAESFIFIGFDARHLAMDVCIIHESRPDVFSHPNFKLKRNVQNFLTYAQLFMVITILFIMSRYH